LEQNGYAFHFEGRVDPAPIVLRSRQWVRIPAKSHQSIFVDLSSDSRRDDIALRRGDERRSQHQSSGEVRGPVETRNGAAKIADRSRDNVVAACGFTGIQILAELVIHVSSVQAIFENRPDRATLYPQNSLVISERYSPVSIFFDAGIGSGFS
jgi:hypothetical protein